MLRRARPHHRAALAVVGAVLGVAWVCGVAAATAPASVAGGPTAAPLNTEAVDRIVAEVAEGAGFNGAVVLMRDGSVVYERAVGLAQRNPDRPYTTTTPTDGGSLAKTLTAAALWELVAEGRLGLDDAVRQHLPEYPFAGHKVRHLVTHRNGLPDYGAFDAHFKPGQVRGTTDLLRLVAARKVPVGLPPGIGVEYSNLGYDIAALVVERITGQPIGAWLRQRYFDRLGMNDAFARPARFADWPGLRTPGYRRQGAGWEPNDAYDGEGFIGASNVHASAQGWARWGDAFARGRVMPAARLDAGLAEPMLASGMDNVLTLLSWYCSADRQRCHYTGAYNGFYAQVYWDRARREVVAYVSNSTLPAWRCAALTRDLVDTLAGRMPTPDAVKAPLRVTSRELPRWAGRYDAPGLGPVTIEAGAGRAAVRVGRGEPASLFGLPGGVFYAPTLDLWLAFTGTPKAPLLHLRSVFHMTDATRRTRAGGG